MALGFGQEERDENYAEQSAAHEEPERPVFSQTDLHVREAADDGERAQEVERRSDGTEQCAIPRRKELSHDYERNIGESAGESDEKDDQGE